MAQMVNNLLTMQTWFSPWVGKTPWRSTGQLIAVFLPGESPRTGEPGGLQSVGLQSLTRLSDWHSLSVNPFHGPLFSLSLESFVVQSLSCVRLFWTQWTAAHQASLSFTSSLPELVQTHVHWISDAIQPHLSDIKTYFPSTC